MQLGGAMSLGEGEAGISCGGSTVGRNGVSLGEGESGGMPVGDAVQPASHLKRQQTPG